LPIILTLTSIGPEALLFLKLYDRTGRILSKNLHGNNIIVPNMYGGYRQNARKPQPSKTLTRYAGMR